MSSAAAAPPNMAASFSSWLLFGVSFTSNMLLFVVSVYSKRLRSTCNFLIATDALLFSFICTNSVALMLVGAVWSQLTRAQCFLAMSPYIVGIEMLSMMPIVIGMERCFQVFFFPWIDKPTPEFYRLLMLFLPLFRAMLALVLMSISLVNLSPHSTLPTCNVQVFYTSGAGAYSMSVNYIVIVVCVILYSAIWIRFKNRPIKPSAGMLADGSAAEKRLFKCICAIVSAYCFCWLMPAILSTITTLFQVDPKTMFTVTVFFYQNIQPISNSLSLPILYTFSEYRPEVNGMLRKVFFNLICCGMAKRISTTNKVTIQIQSQDAVFTRRS